MPKAYVIVDVEVTDPTAYGRYRELSGPALEKYGGRFLARGGETWVLEGSHQPHRVVISEFDSVDAAKQWYDSPEYREARAVRADAANGSFILVEGC
jgi:uncharacterized protein (DUF1330 family)